MTLSFSDVRKELRKDPYYVKEYEALAEEFALARTLIKARLKARMTQKDVAEKMNTTQSAIARLESGTSNPSLRLLARYAKATGRSFTVKITPGLA